MMMITTIIRFTHTVLPLTQDNDILAQEIARLSQHGDDGAQRLPSCEIRQRQGRLCWKRIHVAGVSDKVFAACAVKGQLLELRCQGRRDAAEYAGYHVVAGHGEHALALYIVCVCVCVCVCVYENQLMSRRFHKREELKVQEGK